MCGRFTLTKDGADLLELVEIEHFESGFSWAPNYNISPTQFAPVITLNGKRNMQSMRWGLAPPWAKDTKIRLHMINARSETITEKPTFQNLIKSKRCIVLADGYYEWITTNSVKQPFYIHHPQNQILSFAGLWNKWIDHRQRERLTFTIITTQASKQASYIHNRMPVIINNENIDVWINSESKQDVVLELLKSYKSALDCYPVSTFVNSHRHNEPECIKPINLEDV